MSYELETNRGNVEDFGFIFGDVNRVRLGALPAISIDQFAEYSSETLLQMLSSDQVPSHIKEKVKQEIAFMYGRIHQAQLDQIATDMQRGKILQETEISKIMRIASNAMAGDIGNPERNYTENPFVLNDSKVTISKFYSVEILEFTSFATQIFSGGMFGWTPGNIIPEQIKEKAGKLMGALKE